MDIIKQLGSLAFGSRLKRFSERLMRDVSRIYREQDIDFEARWFPVFYLLKLESKISITEIASALGMTHPAINQIAGEMSRAGLIVSTKDKKDERRRLLSLSARGKKLIKALEPLWQDVVDATHEILETADERFMASIDRMEKALDESELYDRISSRIKKRQYDAIQIVEFKPELARYFKTLNYAWLKKYHKVEAPDKKLLEDPKGRIIAGGGMVIFALLDNEIIGTGALIKHDEVTYEIAKMAVSEKKRGHQAGNKLTRTLIDRALEAGAETIFLQTSPNMIPAIALYKKLGFVDCEDIVPPRYERESITMKWSPQNVKMKGKKNERRSGEK